MSDRIPHLPKYRHYKPKNLAVVRIDSRDIYLGKYDSPESREKYRRVVAEWLTGISPRPATSPDRSEIEAPTVAEVILAFWRHAKGHYRRSDGTPAGEQDNLRLALRPLRQLYGSSPAREFGPKALKAVRESMVASGLCRRTVNQRIARIIRVFRWGVESELVPATVHHGLKAVDSLRRGRSEARESKTIRPVAESAVEAVRPHVSRQVWAIVRLQLLTGMRSGEVCIMRSRDLDTSGRVWTYRPEFHKTEHRGRERTIYIGPRAQEVLRPWLRPEPSEYLFQPCEAEAERQAARRQDRKTPLTPSQLARERKTQPERAPGERYDARSYGHAINRACRKACIPSWHPHQLRHNAATALRKEFGLDIARIILGHSSPAVTETYAEIDRDKALDVMERVG